MNLMKDTWKIPGIFETYSPEQTSQAAVCCGPGTETYLGSKFLAGSGIKDVNPVSA